jgi:uncharacterized membrane protein YphA (DoxX/SURF4 family)
MLLLVGSISLLLGLWPPLGIACIALFLLGVSPMMHNFWAISDPAQRTADMINFSKNMALLGGGLMALGVPTPWPYSLEAPRRVAG